MTDWFFAPPPRDLPDIDEVHVSVAFTYDMPKATQLAESWLKTGLTVHMGGPAFSAPGGDFAPGMYLKQGYVITSRGCNNRCWFCSVPAREGYQGDIFEAAEKRPLDTWAAGFAPYAMLYKNEEDRPILNGDSFSECGYDHR